MPSYQDNYEEDDQKEKEKDEEEKEEEDVSDNEDEEEESDSDDSSDIDNGALDEVDIAEANSKRDYKKKRVAKQVDLGAIFNDFMS